MGLSLDTTVLWRSAKRKEPMTTPQPDGRITLVGRLKREREVLEHLYAHTMTIKGWRDSERTHGDTHIMIHLLLPSSILRFGSR